jgi:hypothetical protein
MNITAAETISVFRQGVAAYNANNRTNLEFVKLESAAQYASFNIKLKCSGIVTVLNHGISEQYEIEIFQNGEGTPIELTDCKKSK